VPTVAAYAHTSNHAYRTSACKNNTSIYKRVIDLTYYDVHSVFNIQNSYFSGNVSETGTAAYFGGLIGYLDSRSLYSAFTNTDYDFDNDCKATSRTTTLSPVARLSQTNIRNSYAIGSVTSDHDYTGSLVGRMDTEDLVPNPNAYKNQIIGEGKNVMSSLTNVYSAVTLVNKGSAVSGYNNNKTYLTVNGVYTWSGASSSNLVWGNATSLPGHASYSFNDAGEAMVGSDKLITKLNATASSLGLSAWKETSYTMPDSKSVKIPSFDLKPQLTEWDSWEGK